MATSQLLVSEKGMPVYVEEGDVGGATDGFLKDRDCLNKCQVEYEAGKVQADVVLITSWSNETKPT